MYVRVIRPFYWCTYVSFGLFYWCTYVSFGQFYWRIYVSFGLFCWCIDELKSLSLRWRHNERDDVSNHQPHDCLCNRLFRRRSKEISKLCVTGLCAGNSPLIGVFHAQRASNVENVSMWWRHHVKNTLLIFSIFINIVCFHKRIRAYKTVDSRVFSVIKAFIEQYLLL